MNKYVLTAVSVAVLSANAAMADGVVVYGKAALSLQNLNERVMDGDLHTQDNYELISNKSRFGIKGEEALNANIKAIYQLEEEVAFDSGDTGSGQTFKQRNTFVGLGGSWGTLMAGINDTPTKMIGKPVDLFNDLKYGDIENSTTGEKRQTNMVMYRSPVMAGVNFDIMVAPGEDKGSDPLKKNPANEKRNGLVNAVSSAMTYQIGGFKVALGLDSKVEQKLSIGSISLGADNKAHSTASPSLDDTGSKFTYDAETDAERLVVSYDNPAFGVAGLVQTAKQASGDVNAVVFSVDQPTIVVADTKFGKTDAESFDTAALAGYYNLGSWKFKALTIQTKFDEADTKFKQTALGVDYKLGKNTIVFGYGSNVKADVDNYEVADNTTFGFGIDHNF